ncbi:ECF transporter S component [Lactiplantibacillus mudanjiangensis]|uniref:ECF transporter S component [Lactobacillus pentosus] n=1 Tax=Lactiplantibacillus mudanjiangensis TaxID=1296538 RepID=A0A660E2J0_9LACO|nr:ECF transporter S component [Lactiplantibacillus mudanjiangensis]VDG17642.1 ECF transporter S component [Lactobacillus pentosus] [Lactiplantibacillus mudanjiangensis]VDG23083.1 ECF transporter S component [Lactobacillus pentosus] [Lactiplantibacillus mudanjiangensis]VDG29556.1 ECF transporter S component [Lactobacillus pentosus] [Lactiplantibacillus mudanjiangensis]VDG32669.1 ECF transporter S component [Lactobacillus pentosus] [Lactiplantibacillus mudanjiangensis]
MQRKSNAYQLSVLAVLTAIVLLQNLVPFLGYIPLPGLSITTIHVTVIIAAVILGPRDGAIIGGVWGLVDWIRAFVAPTSPLAPIVFTNPLVSVLPRVLVGLVAGLIFLHWAKRPHPTVGMVLAGVVGSLVNTILVLGLIGVLYSHAAAGFYQINLAKLMPYLLTIVGTNGIPEAILAGILTPIIATPLLRFKRRHP